MQIKILATGSKGNCYRVSDGVTELLVECGIKYADIMRGLDYSVGNIGAVLVSHVHKDHSLCAAEMAEMGFDMLMPAETAAALGAADFPNVTAAETGKQYKAGTFYIVPFPLVHFNTDGSECPCFGYLIASAATREKLLFATDTAYIKNRFRGLTHVMIEVNYTGGTVNEDCVPEVERRRLKSHMSLETAVRFLESTDRSQLKAIYAVHGSETRSDRDEVYRVLSQYAVEVVVG
ncbi:MAG: MBL fold metallo-hydrolase [Ruminococcus sp.]|nr:MBL fold metallo-hydrolase [Ruminococcus sp.]MCM1381373.1 MBL fold metallo-hydrolase [Muribaculaceae bacterium]MCM1480285.1 MBL fold metallo-hydrolase [Muribaculaceae bacterium]